MACKHSTAYLDCNEVSTVVPLIDPAIGALAQHLPKLQPNKGRTLDCRCERRSGFHTDSHEIAVAPSIADWPRLHFAVALGDQLSGCRPACTLCNSEWTHAHKQPSTTAVGFQQTAAGPEREAMMQDSGMKRCSADLAMQHSAACLKVRLNVTASAEEDAWLLLFIFVSVKPKPFDARSAQFRLFCTRGGALYSPKRNSLEKVSGNRWL